MHAFAPAACASCSPAPASRPWVRGEELLANVYGWALRARGDRADPARCRRLASFAFRSYLALQRVDTALLEPRLPPSLFYNLVFSGQPG